MELRIITPTHNLEEEIPLLNHFLDAGLDYVHIRKPKFGAEEYANFIEKIPTKHHSRLILHSELTLAKYYNLAGIHLRENSRQSMDKRELKDLAEYVHKKGMLMGTSAHDWATLNHLAIDFDYVFVSPVFESISKKGYTTDLDWNINSHKHKYPFVLVALGGIHSNNLSLCSQKGFESVAILGAIWTAVKKAKTEFNGLIRYCRSCSRTKQQNNTKNR